MSIVPPASHLLSLTPGAPLLLQLQLKSSPGDTPLDLTGAQVKLAFWSSDGQQEYARCSADLSDGVNGRVNLELTGDETALIPVDAYYDCLLINSRGKRRYLFYGLVQFVEPNLGPPAKILVIGNPFYSLGVSDPTAIESNPTVDIIGVQNAIYMPDVGGGQPGFVAAYGGFLSRDESTGTADRESFVGFAAFDLNLNPIWQHGSIGAIAYQYLYIYEVTSTLSRFPGGRVGSAVQGFSLGGGQVRYEFISCLPGGGSLQRHAYLSTDYGEGASDCQDLLLSENSNLYVLYFTNRVASMNGSMSARWLCGYSGLSPIFGMYFHGMAVTAGVDGDVVYVCGRGRTSALSPGGLQDYGGVIGVLDEDGIAQGFYHYLDVSVDKPSNLDCPFEIFSLVVEESGTLIACGYTNRGTEALPDWGDSALFLARIDPADGSVLDAKAYRYLGGTGSVFAMAFATVDDSGNIYVSANAYWQDPGVNPGGENLCTVFKVDSSLSLVGAMNAVGVTNYGYTYGRPALVGSNLAVPTILDGGSWLPTYDGSATDGLVLMIPVDGIGTGASGNYGSIEYDSGTAFTLCNMTDLFVAEDISLSVTSFSVTRQVFSWADTTATTADSAKEPAFAVLERL